MTKQQPQEGHLNIQVNGTPVGLSFDVFLRQNGTETRIGSFACPAHVNHWSYYVGNPWPTGTTGAADVILRTNPAAAANTVDTFEAWHGEINLKDVPVREQ